MNARPYGHGDTIFFEPGSQTTGSQTIRVFETLRVFGTAENPASPVPPSGVFSRWGDNRGAKQRLSGDGAGILVKIWHPSLIR